MDVYTTAFSYPAPHSPTPAHIPKDPLSVPPQAGGTISGTLATSTPRTAPAAFTAVPLPNVPEAPPASADCTPPKSPQRVEREWEAVQQLASDITAREGCLVTVTRESTDTMAESSTVSDPPVTIWNFHLSGVSNAVLSARGSILRDAPQDNRITVKVHRSDILEASQHVLKQEVVRRLGVIAIDSKAFISVVSYDNSSNEGQKVLATASEDGVKTLESENGKAGYDKLSGRMDNGSAALEEIGYKFIVTGPIESVHIAKVRLLVMIDELSGLHAEICDIDYKLHNIIAGRKRAYIQQIQEETGTNIYLPTSLVGVMNDPPRHQNLDYQMTGVGMRGQPTGPLGMQMTGMSHVSGMGGMPMVMPGINGGFNPQNHSRQGPPVYNPHQHVHYPYQPQPLNVDPSATRGVPYNGPGAHYPMHAPPPMSVDHTGMSALHGGFQSVPQSRIASPMPPQSHHSPLSGATGMGFNTMNHSNHLAPPSHQSHPPWPQSQNFHPGMHNMGHNVPMGVGGMPMGMNPMNHMNQFGMTHPGLSIHGGEQGKLGKANQIWISGEFFGVQRARDMLLNIAMQKCKLIISRDAAILPRKLDWLLTGKKIDEVRNIMNDNGTYVQVPCVGGQTSMISVFGDHRANIERTIRSIMALACQFYVASLWLLPPPVEVGPRVVLNPAQIQPVVKHISHVTGAEIVYKPNMFEVNGLERQVTSAMLLLMDVDVLHNFVPEVRFRVELANEQREFFSGKKNGKINKIMKMTNAKIRFETLNDYNFLIDIAGKNQDALQGLSLIQEELPAEISFYVPESYHKRIIGVGGKNIQKIMKIYNSFVKFSNAEEFASLGGYFDNEDNVYAKTPSKNGANLWELKQAIMDVVGLKERNFYTDYVSIPRPYHRTLLGEKSIFIHDIEQKTNTVVRFPYKETGSDVVSIFGPATEVPLAATLLLEHVPFDVSTTHVPRQAVQLEQTESLFGKMTLDSDTNGANGAGSKGLPVPQLSFHQDRRIEELWPIVNPVSQRPAPTRTESDHQKRESDPVINDRIRQASTGHVPAGSHSGALPPHRHHPHSQSRINANRHQSLDISQLNFSRALSGGKSSPFGMMPGSPPTLDSSPNTATGGFMPRAPSPPGRL
ncbi:hypothetical protein B9479_004971 [Cryptococcus floricola]|uniref:K Homology domain-containing protein n=1 Tax=Cryptococcus floricola TaxID=2591691 RepID=A0A5D3AW87_9TREE|nr:hypothetical protein B9479_004971 [Cryptococcus floricola]